jgi:hypothetical protein
VPSVWLKQQQAAARTIIGFMPPIAIIGFIIIGSMAPIAPPMAPIMLGSRPIEVLFILCCSADAAGLC